jgi:hypothetical protein
LAHPALSEEKKAEALEALKAHKGNATNAAKSLGLSRTTFQTRVQIAQATNKNGDKEKPFTVAPIPDEELDHESLIEWRKRQFEQKRRHKEAAKLRDVRIRLDGPIAIAHFGDPHVDDDGTDIALLERHMDIVNATEGMFGANLGDLQNNWIGRLARLWAQQGTSAKQAWMLTEWMCRKVNWLYLVGGNHDAWSGNGDPLKWIMAQSGTAFDYSGLRLNLKFPNGKCVRVNARHDFHGHSMWNPAHGPMKAIQGGWRDHIATCGHKHVSFTAGPLKDPSTGLLSWAIRCAGYKTFDRYAEEEGLPDQNAFPACVTIIDPRYADDDARLITVISDVETGADFLKFLRKRAA